MKSGNLNFLEPSGPLQACNGNALPLPFFLYLTVFSLFHVCLTVFLPQFVFKFAVHLSLHWDLKVMFNSLGRVTNLPLGRNEDGLDDPWRDNYTRSKQVYQGLTVDRWLWWWWWFLIPPFQIMQKSGEHVKKASVIYVWALTCWCQWVLELPFPVIRCRAMWCILA